MFMLPLLIVIGVTLWIMLRALERLEDLTLDALAQLNDQRRRIRDLTEAVYEREENSGAV